MAMSYAKGAPSYIELEFSAKIDVLLAKTGGVTEANFLATMLAFGRHANHYQMSYSRAVAKLWSSLPERIANRVQGLFENGKPYAGEKVEHINFLEQSWVPVSGRETFAFGTGLHPPNYRPTAAWGRVAGHGVPVGGVAKHVEG